MQDLHLHCDNMSTIKLAKNPVFHARTKHLEIHHHFVRERVLEGKLQVQHISTQLQPADILTKVLPRLKFDNNKTQLGMKSISQVQNTDLFSTA